MIIGCSGIQDGSSDSAGACKLLFFFFETGSGEVAHAGLEHVVLLSQSPRVLGSWVCPTMPSYTQAPIFYKY